MASDDRIKIRRLLLSRLKQFISKKILEEKIDDFVDEYIEKCNFIKNNNINMLPSKREMKWWFQEKPDTDKVKLEDGTIETNFEVDIDTICLHDKLATEVFKNYYNWYWEDGCKIPYVIKDILKLFKKYKNCQKNHLKREYKEKISNIALVGTIRLNKIERKPYLCPSEIIKCCNSLIMNLELLDNIINKKNNFEKSKLYIFDAFNKMRVE